MIKKIAGVLAIALVILCGCKNNSKDQAGIESKAKKDSVSTESYYPITQYIESQIAYLDSTPLAIEMTTYVNNKLKDSVYIERKEFKKIVQEFLSPDLNKTEVKPLYAEDSYNDLSLNTITFSYTARDREQEMEQEDILLNPDNNVVKHVMFRKHRLSGDTTININGLWKHNMNCQLNYVYTMPGGKTETRQVKLVWDKPLPSY